jgi:ATP-dependent DNA ligase
VESVRTWRNKGRPGLERWKTSTMPPSSPSSWALPEPMRAVPVNDPTLPAGWAAQPKWGGYRALAGRWADGHVAVRSRNGSDLARALPEIEEAVRLLPDEVAVDVARESAGRWRHPVRLTRIRTDMGTEEVPLFGAAH